MDDVTDFAIPAPVIRRIADLTDRALAALASLEHVAYEWQMLAHTTAVLADDPAGDGAFDPYMEASGFNDLQLVLDAIYREVEAAECGPRLDMTDEAWRAMPEAVAVRVACRRLEYGLGGSWLRVQPEE